MYIFIHVIVLSYTNIPIYEIIYVLIYTLSRVTLFTIHSMYLKYFIQKYIIYLYTLMF